MHFWVLIFSHIMMISHFVIHSSTTFNVYNLPLQQFSPHDGCEFLYFFSKNKRTSDFSPTSFLVFIYSLINSQYIVDPSYF